MSLTLAQPLTLAWLCWNRIPSNTSSWQTALSVLDSRARCSPGNNRYTPGLLQAWRDSLTNALLHGEWRLRK